MNKNIVFIAFVIMALSGCTIPRSGFKSDIINNEGNDYELVDISKKSTADGNDTDAINKLIDILPSTFWRWEYLTAGDLLHVTIIATGGAGYLSNSTGDRADFENIIVSGEQTVSIPYAGKIDVKEVTTAQLAEEIQTRLARVVLNPQVLVTLTSRTGALVTLQGAVGKAGRIPIEQSMHRLSHLVAVAAPENVDGNQVEVILTRQSRHLNLRLADLYQSPLLDVSLQPDDQIVIRQITEYINVLGAAGEQGKHQLVKRYSNVIDALALAKGLDDKLADPRAVFLFRHDEMLLAKRERRKPYIYHIDMSNPKSVFDAKEMRVSDGDVIYISNASLTDFAKVKAAFDSFLISGSSAFK